MVSFADNSKMATVNAFEPESTAPAVHSEPFQIAQETAGGVMTRLFRLRLPIAKDDLMS